MSRTNSRKSASRLNVHEPIHCWYVRGPLNAGSCVDCDHTASGPSWVYENVANAAPRKSFSVESDTLLKALSPRAPSVETYAPVAWLGSKSLTAGQRPVTPVVSSTLSIWMPCWVVSP